MRQQRKTYLSISAITAFVLVSSVLGIGALLAQPRQAAAKSPVVTGSAQAASIVGVLHQQNMATVPQATPANLNAAAHDIPLRTRIPAQRYAQIRANASASAPRSSHSEQPPTEHLAAAFPGIQSSAAVCPPVGCNPPDMGLAASPRWVLNGVNTSFAVYDTHGNLQPGWPKTFQDFFGVPSPGSCAAGGIPFTSDPREAYDPNTDRFIAAALEIEGAFSPNNCPFTSRYWIAVSQTGDPRGGWNIYSFDTTLGTTNGNDFTMIGFDDQAVYFSADMFTNDGSAFAYAEIFGASKAGMEAGQSVTAHGFFNLQVTGPAGTFPVSEVQPVETEAQGRGPGAEFFVNIFNGFDPVSGHLCTSAADACAGLTVWAFHGPVSSPSLGFAYVGNTKAYTFAPAADQTSCLHCVDPSDLRISATPIYRDGSIYAGWESGVDNGTQVVPGIVWSQLRVHAAGGQVDATQVAGDYFNFTGDNAVVYPAFMPDNQGDVFMVFDRMSSSTNPEVRLTVRRAGDTDFESPGALIKAGQAPYRASQCGTTIPVCRWGDYSATSYDGFETNHVWFAGQYANAPTILRNWGTFVGELSSGE